jgi:ATP-dependent Clp protease ATP-binding subunit ClpA
MHMTAITDELAKLIHNLGRSYGRAPSVAEFIDASSELNLLSDKMAEVKNDPAAMHVAARHNVSLKTWVEWLTLAKSNHDDVKLLIQHVVTQALESPAALQRSQLSPERHDVTEGPAPSTDAPDSPALKIVGRDDEIREILRILCRRTKSNPVLLGPAGVGKTAIVDGVRSKLLADDVPDILKGRKIVDMPISGIKSNRNLGDAIAMVQKTVATARRNNDILFVDECHTLFGIPQIADELKPLLARGDISMIGATTDREYRQEVASDAALDRRFQPVLIQQLGRAGTLACLEVHRDHLKSLRGISVSDSILSQLYDKCDTLMPSRSFPDKAIDILEDLVAECLLSGLGEPSDDTLSKTVSTRIGVTTDRTGAEETERSLIQLGLEENLAEKMAAKLSIAAVGLDIYPQRPNLTVALRGWTDQSVKELVNILASANGSQNVEPIYIDLSSMVEDIVSPLIGASPQYVGYDAQLPIHALLQRPGAILIFNGYGRCHPNIRNIVDDLVKTGVILDGALRTISASQAAIVVIDRPLDIEAETKDMIGFRRHDSSSIPDSEQDTYTTNHPWFDFEINIGPEIAGTTTATHVKQILSNYSSRGIEITIDNSAATALATLSNNEVQDLFEHVIVPQAVVLGQAKPMSVTVHFDGNQTWNVTGDLSG